MSNMVIHRHAYASAEPCWRCGGQLVRIEPPFGGSWRFYCQACQHLTSPKTEINKALAGMPAGAIGMITHVPVRLAIIPDKDPSDGHRRTS